ncbi:hypothetical protein B6U74_05115 [Candidatus Bathyarchaeota archaeon ex4484_205]|nr:MAG: hypothetical protein B6U74_05115 [Candidatus Bathyarchaeota archaeon ex4484_205]
MEECDEIESLINSAIQEYNRYFSPEVNAQLLLLENDYFTVKFSGSFCQTCGFYEYFDDLRYIFEDHGIVAEIVEIREMEGGAEVKFRLHK